MKRLFSILAVAAAVVAACSVTSCKKNDNPLTSVEWVNETTVNSYEGVVPRVIVYTFSEGNGANYTCYLNGSISSGNGGTYTYDAPNLTISFTVPVCTETGVLEGDKLTINTRDYGTLEFTKKK